MNERKFYEVLDLQSAFSVLTSMQKHKASFICFTIKKEEEEETNVFGKSKQRS